MCLFCLVFVLSYLISSLLTSSTVFLITLHFTARYTITFKAAIYNISNSTFRIQQLVEIYGNPIIEIENEKDGDGDGYEEKKEGNGNDNENEDENEKDKNNEMKTNCSAEAIVEKGVRKRMLLASKFLMTAITLNNQVCAFVCSLQYCILT